MKLQRSSIGRLFRDACAVVLAFVVTPCALHAQIINKVRKPYDEAVVVEANAVVLSFSQQASRWRSPFDGQSGFYSWRMDVNGGPGLSIVLAADTMMRAANLTQVVGGSVLRRCQDAHNLSARSCTIRLSDSVGVKDEFVQIVLRDSASVSFFREVRPATVRVSTFEPHGRYRLERFRVRYRDRLNR